MSGKMKNSALKFLILSILTLGSPPALQAAGKDTLSVGVSGEFETLNPIILSISVSRYMSTLSYRPLVTLSIDNKWVPILATKIPTFENKMVKRVGEGLDVTVEIRPEAQWGDGVPVTCKDIDFAVTVGKSPNVSTPSKEGYENIKAVKWDEKTPKKCVISFVKAKFNYFANFIDPMPSHLEGPIFEKYKNQPQGYDNNTLYTKNPNNPGLYNGPYVVSDLKLGSHVTFTANPKFGGKKPQIRQITFKLIPNGNTLPTRLQAGDIDIITPASGFTLDQAVAFEKKIQAEKLPYKVMWADGVIYSHIDVNLENPALSDLAVRKALSLGFNKKEMIQSLLEGRAKVAHHFVTEKNPWYTEKVPVYNYNRREAAKILDEAGWKAGSDGIRSKDGKKLSFTIYGGAGSKLIENIEAYLQSQWKSIGIELKIKNEPLRILFSETIPKRKFDLALYSWVSIPESSPRSMLHSEMIPSEKNSWSGQNNPGYRNPEMDKLIDQLEGEFDAKKRGKLGQKIVEIYARDIPVIPLYYRPDPAVVPLDLKGYKPSGHLGYETHWAEEWSRN